MRVCATLALARVGLGNALGNARAVERFERVVEQVLVDAGGSACRTSSAGTS
jgi:hypothetical protein